MARLRAYVNYISHHIVRVSRICLPRYNLSPPWGYIADIGVWDKSASQKTSDLSSCYSYVGQVYRWCFVKDVHQKTYALQHMSYRLRFANTRFKRHSWNSQPECSPCLTVLPFAVCWPIAMTNHASGANYSVVILQACANLPNFYVNK